MAQIAESGHYRIDQLDMAERLWMGENDARQRVYVNNWRQAKWAKQAAFEKLKREIKEAKDKANKEWFAANYGNLGSHGGVSSVAGTSTITPIPKLGDPNYKEFWIKMELNRQGATGAITPDYTFEKIFIPLNTIAKMLIFSNSGSSTVFGLDKTIIYIKRSQPSSWQRVKPSYKYTKSIKYWKDGQWKHLKDWE